MQSHKHAQPDRKKSPPAQAQDGAGFIPQAEPSDLVQKAQTAASLSPSDVFQLQRTLGNHAVSQMLGGQPVQRLMGVDTFKENTSLFARKRNKIKLVDAEITTYQGLAVDAYQARATQLGVIITECNTYLGYTDKQAKRKAGVREFLLQAQKEKDIYDALVLYNNAAGRKAKYDELNKAQDAANQADTLGYEVGAVLGHINIKVAAVLTDIRTNEPGVLAQILQDDVNKLQAIIAAPNTPAITQAVITEVLANIGDVNLTEGPPGARHTNATERGRGVTEKYTVLHSLEQSGGTAERLGSLEHELTHVASGESFNNTSLFLLFDPASTADQITDMARHRKDEVQALRALCGAAPFSAKQKDLIESKLKYAVQDKLGLYVARFYEAGKIDLATKNKLWQVAQAIPENNTLIEYDSVVNQCLIYMQQWNIPQTNAFYVKLMQVAQDAYDLRQ